MLYKKLLHGLLNYDAIKVLSLFLASSVTMLYAHSHHNTSSFSFTEGVISSATLSGVSISARINLFYIYVSIGIVTFFALVILLNLLCQFLQPSSERLFSPTERRIIILISLFGIVNELALLFGSNNKTLIQLLLIIVLVALFNKVLSHFLLKMRCLGCIRLLISRPSLTIWIFVFAYGNSLLWMYAGKEIGVTAFTQPMISYLLGILTTYLIFLVLNVLPFQGRSSRPPIHYQIPFVLFPLFLLPGWIALANEIYLILSEHQIFVLPKVLVLGGAMFAFCCTIFLLIKKGSFGIGPLRSLRTLYYPALLIQTCLLAYRPAVFFGPPGELFESGNPGVAIQQLFQFGKLPLLQTFNAHGLSELLAPFIYVLLNGFHGWDMVIYSSFFTNLLLILISYAVLRHLIGSEMSLLIVLLMPNLQLVISGYFVVALVPMFYIWKVIQNKSILNYILLWLVLALEVLWRYDIGFASVVATLIILAINSLYSHSANRLKWLLISALSVLLVFFAAFVSLALIENVSLASRIPEMLRVFGSNQVWGYTTLGDRTKESFPFYYFVVPAFSLIVLYQAIHISLHERKRRVLYCALLSAYVAIFTLANFPRGLVRHSLFEITGVVSGFLGLLFILEVFLLNKALRSLKTLSAAVIVALSYVVLVATGIGGPRSVSPAVTQYALTSSQSFHDYAYSTVPIKRYREPQTFTQNIYVGLKELFDSSLTPKETFIDFSDSPYLYVLTRRPTPMYINQTPAFLSDTVTQKAYLSEIKNYSEPYAIFPDLAGWGSLDGVPEELRAYKVAEYVYANYIPFIKVNGFIVWVRKDFQARAIRALSSIKGVTYQTLPSVLTPQTFDMQWLPYEWGLASRSDLGLIESGSYLLAENASISSGATVYYSLPSLLTDSKGSFIVLNATVKPEKVAPTMRMEYGSSTNGSFEKLGAFSFYLMPDGLPHTYLIRASSQFNWVKADPSNLRVTPQRDININKLEVLRDY